MANRTHSFVKEEYYHIYNRGNSKQDIFLDIQDYRYFQDLLYVMNKIDRARSSYKRSLAKNQLVAIGAYCLMPNHFHILITPTVHGDVSLFMKKVMTGYVMYFNKKYERTGSLFEGVFKSKIISNDNHLKYLFAYIHLNPVKLIDEFWKRTTAKSLNKKVEHYLSEYSFSSHFDYVGIMRPESIIISREAFPNFFPKEYAYLTSLKKWIALKIEEQAR